MPSQSLPALQEKLNDLIEQVRSKKFPYVARKQERRDWRPYDMAQENEIPDVLFLIGKLVDAASASLKLPPRIDAAGRDPFPEDDLAKFVLAQQYDGRSTYVDAQAGSTLR